MKKKLFFLTICLSFLLLLPGSIKAGKLKFGVKISGGMDYLSVGDPNTVRQGFTDHWKDAETVYGSITTEGEFNAINWGFDFQTDVIIYLNKRFGLSIGFGYINGDSKKNSNEIIMNDTYSKTYETKMSAVPIIIGVYYSFPISSKVRFFLNGGPGYYFAKFSDNYRDEWSTGWSSRSQEASASGIGFQGGLGFEYDISKNISLVFEGQGRYAKISGFEGEQVWSNYKPDGGTTEGVLYYFEYYSSWLSDWYPIVKIRTEEPTGAEARNAREAVVDFSGFLIRIGIKIRF
ncbi:MAG: outer membrane beta-barrel protein [Candidatus Aminicenantes bacterium]|nr:outer membrane beta-barrel protein [Candidatus Aminicenantes bacterium]